MMRTAFPKMELSYADHISTETENRFALNFPVYAYLSGCSFIEKHICHHRKTTQYDATAALEASEAAIILEDLQQIGQCLSTGFITANEKDYYLKTQQKPVLAKSLSSGQLVAPVDVKFRRSDKKGLSFQEVKEIQKEFNLLNRTLGVGDTITKRDFRKARIAAIVSGRVESSRSPIQEMPFIESCLKSHSVGQVILVTSTPRDNSVLGETTLGGKVQFWQEDQEDVIASRLGACANYGIDVILQVTGDCSLISQEITEYLLKAHFEAGADLTKPNHSAVEFNCQVYNVQALQQVIHLAGRVEDSEDMALYMTNYPSLFKINSVDLPEKDQEFGKGS
jgi:spore coat polysaccharide biosynthesis protein SpsF (cytidylyltransferase family)